MQSGDLPLGILCPCSREHLGAVSLGVKLVRMSHSLKLFMVIKSEIVQQPSISFLPLSTYKTFAAECCPPKSIVSRLRLANLSIHAIIIQLPDKNTI